MTGWLIAIDVVTLLVAVPALLIAGFVLRRVSLQRGGATFEASMRAHPAHDGERDDGGWTLGIARYETDAIVWFRLFSPVLRPKLVLPRATFRVLGRRQLEVHHVSALMPGSTVLEVGSSGERYEFAISDAALTALLSWLESAPPGASSGVT